MPAYWRCMRWALAQPFTELEQRAHTDVAFTRLWERPDEFRGELVRLDLHIRRVMEYPAEENSANVDKVYEVWGATSESRTFPYVVVCPELPPGIRVSTELRQRGVFVGYLLKTLAFTAADNKRHASPLLIGRLHAAAPQAAPARPAGPTWPWLVGGALLIVIGVFAWRRLATVKPRPRPLTSTDEQSAESWFAGTQDDER
jgi:hypothetical protein